VQTAKQYLRVFVLYFRKGCGVQHVRLHPR
jgi:hypothetical protein